jgi:acylphosphatase
VQGVGFRESTVREANKYPGLRGFVKNLPDGRVEALFCGDENAVLKIVAWCRKGPATAQVTHLEVIEESRDIVIAREPLILEGAFDRK